MRERNRAKTPNRPLRGPTLVQVHSQTPMFAWQRIQVSSSS